MRSELNGAALVSIVVLWLAPSFTQFDAGETERTRVLTAANKYVKESPVTVTAAISPRSAGGPHDYFSEGDYWWPDPQNPGGPYIQKDGLSNPDNFNDHRRALMRFSVQMPGAGDRVHADKDQQYATRAAARPRVVRSRRTRMTPALRYAQAIHGASRAAAPASSTRFTWSRWHARWSGSTALRGWSRMTRPGSGGGSPTTSTG